MVEAEGHVSDLVHCSPAEFAQLTHEIYSRLAKWDGSWEDFWKEHVYKHRKSKFFEARVFCTTLLMVQVGAILAPPKEMVK